MPSAGSELDQELRNIIALAEAEGFGSRRGRFWPCKTIVHHRGGHFKIRRYPSSEWAQKQERMVQLAVGVIEMPNFLGRLEEYLVFDYPLLEPDKVVPQGQLLYSIGVLLGRLGSLSPGEDIAQQITFEFAAWIDDLQRINFISKQVAEILHGEYFKNKPIKAAFGLDYWDAMPHNFGWGNDALLLLDEKHLRFSYKGVGLIKLKLLLEKKEFQQVLRGFASVDDVAFFERQYPFLLRYYLVAALHFYYLQLMDGDRWIPANSRMRYYRSGLIRSVSSSAGFRLKEAARFVLQYPLESFAALVNRLKQPLTWSKLKERIRTEVSPWDDDAF